MIVIMIILGVAILLLILAPTNREGCRCGAYDCCERCCVTHSKDHWWHK